MPLIKAENILKLKNRFTIEGPFHRRGRLNSYIARPVRLVILKVVVAA